MKRQILSMFFLPLCLIFSCAKEDFQNETAKDEEKNLNARSLKNELSRLSEYYSNYNYLGSGYDISKEYANENSVAGQVIDIDKFKAENNISTSNPNSQNYAENYGENAHSYLKSVSTNVNSGFDFPLFKMAVSSSFGYSETSNEKFDAKYIYSSYNLLIKQRRHRFNAPATILQNYLSENFKRDLSSFTPAELVKYYGTHILSDIYTGAKLEIKFQSETENTDRAYASRIGLKVASLSIFNVDVDNEVNTSSSDKNYNGKLVYTTRGGDPSRSLIGQIDLEKSTTKINIASWQNSSTPQNSVLVDFGEDGLILIYDLISDPAKKAEVKAYVDKYLLDNQAALDYIPTVLYSYHNQPNSDHYFHFDSDLQPSNYWTNEGPTGFKVFKYQAPNTVPIYCYKSTAGAHHYYVQASSIQPSSYWNVYMGVAFYAYKEPGTDRVPVYNYKAHHGSDHYLHVSPNLGPSSYWTREEIAFYAPLN